MDIISVPIKPFPDQRPGTSGLRREVSVFRQHGYVEGFVQSIFDALPEAVGDGVARKTLVLGGDDGRFFASEAANHHPHGGGQRRRTSAGRPRRVVVDAGGERADPQAPSLRRDHPVGKPQSGRAGRRFRHQVQCRQWLPAVEARRNRAL